MEVRAPSAGSERSAMRNSVCSNSRSRRIAERSSTQPPRGVKLPRKTSKPRAYLDHTQVATLAAASSHPELVVFLAYTGLRWGEATGLRVKHVDLTRRRVSVEENAVEVGSFIEIGTPKTHEKRQVPYPAFFAEAMKRMVDGKTRDQLVFGDGQIHMRRPKSTTGWFNSAVARAQASTTASIADALEAGVEPPRPFPRVTPHDLRHTAASLAISAGANVKAVQRMLGHASAAMTLDTYADLFDDDLDAVCHAAIRWKKNTPRSQSRVGIAAHERQWAPWGSNPRPAD